MNKNPLIGITMRLEIETERFYLGRHYSEAIESTGGIPIHISLIPKRNYIRQILENVDGILLPGSDSDIDPYYYDEEPSTKLKKVVPEKDQTDLLVLEEAEKLKLPILAICFGMQTLNVYQGGTLIQDIETEVEKPIRHEQGSPLDRLSHTIKVKDESNLQVIINKSNYTEQIKVNSHHHQAVKKIGENLSATAWAADNTIKCLEGKDKERFVFGIQWHPEISFQTDSLSKQIFKTFVGECADFAKNKRKI